MNMSSAAKLFRYSIIVLPLVLGVLALAFILSGRYGQFVAQAGAMRLVASGWEESLEDMEERQPKPKQHFAYYQVKEGQTLEELVEMFSVNQEKLTKMNPGIIVPGVTIKVPPIEYPFEPKITPNGLIGTTKIIDDGVFVRVRGDFEDQQVITSLPELADYLDGYGVIERTGPKDWRILRPLSIEDNIRLDITPETVELLELRSDPNDITCLCFENAFSLIRDTRITTYDSKTSKPDINPDDERSYIRARKSSRMDMINSHLSFLGNKLIKSNKAMQTGGGVYGVSWRIPDDRLHIDISTGWVENNTFYKNHFGGYTFGASGMRFKDNHFLENDVYGLDPHDDSNNALVDGNVFEKNGKHGFIVSKRCNNNIIINNKSFGNGLHGFMIHEDSTNNLIEGNEAFGNTDNYVVYDSTFNVIRNNTGRDAGSSNVRINQNSSDIYVTGNEFDGGLIGVYIYRESERILINGNKFSNHATTLKSASSFGILFASNDIPGLKFNFDNSEAVVFGPNSVTTTDVISRLE